MMRAAGVQAGFVDQIVKAECHSIDGLARPHPKYASFGTLFLRP